MKDFGQGIIHYQYISSQTEFLSMSFFGAVRVNTLGIDCAMC
jgi:hypothetical protein